MDDLQTLFSKHSHAPMPYTESITGPAEKGREFYTGDPAEATFHSLADMYSFLRANLTDKDGRLCASKAGYSKAGYSYDRPEQGRRWSWNHNTADAMALAVSGWPEIRAHIPDASSLSDGINSDNNSLAATYDVEGNYVDIGRYLDGDPECMVRKTRSGSKSVRIIVDAFVSFSESANDIAKRGATIAAAVLALQARNYTVSLELFTQFGAASNGGNGPSTTSALTVVLQSAGCSIDESSLLFALCHPAFTRILLFQTKALVAGTEHNGSQNYDERFTNKPGVVFIPGMLTGHPWGSPEKCRELVEQAMTAAATVD